MTLELMTFIGGVLKTLMPLNVQYKGIYACLKELYPCNGKQYDTLPLIAEAPL